MATSSWSEAINPLARPHTREEIVILVGRERKRELFLRGSADRGHNRLLASVPQERDSPSPTSKLALGCSRENKPQNCFVLVIGLHAVRLNADGARWGDLLCSRFVYVRIAGYVSCNDGHPKAHVGSAIAAYL